MSLPLLKRGFEAFRAGNSVLVRKIARSRISLVLYLDLGGRKPWSLDVRYAFLHEAAEAFAIECVNRASGAARLVPTGKWHSYLKFSVGEFLGWSPGGKRWSSDSETKEAFSGRVLNEIAIDLVPKLEWVDGERALLQMLLDADKDGHRTWWRTNGAIRAAVILYIGGQLKSDYADLVSQVMQHAKQISLGIEGRTVEGLPERFVEQVIDALKIRGDRAGRVSSSAK